MKKEKVIHTQGKRKRAIARATLVSGKGKITINGSYLENFGSDMEKLRISEPFLLAGDLSKEVDLDINVRGGGMNGQADAIRLAVARALVSYNGKLKKTFEDYDRQLLVADVRRKEVCKPNDSKARAKRQKSYR